MRCRLCDVGDRAGDGGRLEPGSGSALHHWPELKVTPLQIVDMLARTTGALLVPLDVYVVLDGN